MALKFIRPNKTKESETQKTPEKLTATLEINGMLTFGTSSHNILKLYNPKSVSFANNDEGELIMVVMDGKYEGDFPVSNFLDTDFVQIGNILKYLFVNSAKDAIEFVLVPDETITDMNAYKMIRNF